MIILFCGYLLPFGAAKTIRFTTFGGKSYPIPFGDEYVCIVLSYLIIDINNYDTSVIYCDNTNISTLS